MKLITKISSVILLVLSAFNINATELQPTAQVGIIQSYTLHNGFKLILVPYPDAPTAKIELLVKTGSKLEGYGETGMAHLLEHMLFKSTRNRKNIKTDLVSIGATWNGTTSTDRTNYFETVAAEQSKIDEAIKIEADRFMHATFTKEDLQSEMTVVRNELERNDTNPDSLVMRELQRLSYTWHGYSRPTIGAKSDIEDAPFEVLQAFYKKHYRPDNAAMIVSGKFDIDHTLALVELLFGEEQNPDTTKITSWTRDDVQPKTRRSELVTTSGKIITASSWKIPGILDIQTYALNLGVNAICDSDWGTLRKELVIAQKLATHTSCGTSIKPDYSLFIASANATKDIDVNTLSKALTNHIERAVEIGITQEQFNRISQSERNTYIRIENTYTSLASMLSAAEVAGDWRLYFWQKELLNKIALEDINLALKKWIITLNRNDVLLAPVEEVNTLEIVKSLPIDTIISTKKWEFSREIAEKLPESALELSKQVQTINASEHFRISYIKRKTQGNMVWLNIDNDIGNEEILRGQEIACAVASNLIAYGTKDANRDDLDRKLESLNAHWSISKNNLDIEVPKHNLQKSLDILLNLWINAILPEDEFNRMKSSAITSIESTMRDPSSMAANAAQVRFDNYPQNHPFKPLSYIEQLNRYKAINYTDMKKCANELSGLASIRLSVVGDITKNEIQEIISKIETLPKSSIGYERIRNIEAPKNVDPSPITISMPQKPNATIAGITYLPIMDSDHSFPALRIAIEILGGNANSRIWKRLREKEGLAYSSGATLSGNSFDPRTGFSIHASAASKNADTAQQALKEELSNLIRSGITAEELEKAKHEWSEARKTALRVESNFASILSDALLTGHDYTWIAEYDDKISHLTVDNVNNAIKTYLGNATIVWYIGKGD